ncbi:MAG: hypothetical protein AB7G39_04850 [Alphaproteobacteria bacterium]
MTMSSSVPARPGVPEIPEGRADSATRAIYAEIKAASGTPLVNLVYRHFATLDGMLPWTWTTIRDGLTVDALVGSAACLPRLRGLPGLPVAAFAAVGVDERTLQVLRSLVDDYNRTNAFNLIAMLALEEVLARHGSDGVRSAPPRTVRSLDAIGEAPSILSFEDLADATSDMVVALNRVCDSDEPRCLATMYRQFAHWPGLLALALGYLRGLEHGRIVTDAKAAVLAAGRIEAQALVASAKDRLPVALPPADRAQASAALSMFIEEVIGKMIPIGQALACFFADGKPQPIASANSRS